MNITLLDSATLAKTSLAPFEKLGHFKHYTHTSAEQVVCHSENAHVLITNKVILNRSTLAQLPQLKLICVAATGTNNIDLDAAKEQGIAVTNVADYSTASVVQHTFALITNLLGNSHRYIIDSQQGMWQKSAMFCRLDYPINEIAGKTFVIIGYGSLGKAVADVAKAFGANVVISERKGHSPREGRTEFTQAIKQADIISIHCPLTDESRDLISAPELLLMKPNAVLINTARGGIVNETELAYALSQSQIAGAGFDVLTKEPAAEDNPLVNYSGDNLILTPHIAWASAESINRLVSQVSLNIKAFAQGESRNRLV
ncbi:D-2-hydroxyacid dehydrogenase [Pseudoalteromonas shioyasakiensis]|uniref:D-2-hydroxyacid dehydrogenase n=1 Tax=Pseudoalteromonas shioyasakiensis TaxID=1190813 RepID=UPI002118C2B6|nr:D-2-hydroxyacid dehydrogenase [Pseudoalteromonas shioyasakiensis]MCQ8878159.1 D-2-hydroxyacid dehydrogenase [Pseudoalteromonas shioyasakiensis]